VSTRERVLDALGTVRDPELDEPITSLRFVTSCEVSRDGDVEVLLRLPTPQCAPNFAFLMAADARRAVGRLPDVRQVTVRFEDHYTGEEINSALARGQGFTGAFPGETDDDDLEGLRELFNRKALIARQARVCKALMAAGWRISPIRPTRGGVWSSGPTSDWAVRPMRPGSCCPAAGRWLSISSIAGCGRPGWWRRA
jgi:metal-sulfur cluster biosynthetic enzyme